jgi:putative transposase
MARDRYKVLEINKPYFFTAVVSGWQPVFTRPQTVKIIIDSWKYLIQESSLKLYGYVILENHLHFIAQSNNIASDVKRFKSFTARKIIDYLVAQNTELILQHLIYNKKSFKPKSTYQLWQEGSHPKLIDNESICRQKLNYIHNNPVKRGYVDLPEHWRYSSARNYNNQPGLLEVFKEW